MEHLKNDNLSLLEAVVQNTEMGKNTLEQIVPMTDDLEHSVRLATGLRERGIRVQLYAEQKKFKAKIQYADKLHIPYVIFLGEDEVAAGTVSLKDLRSGEQITVPAADAAERILADIELRGQGTILK